MSLGSNIQMMADSASPGGGGGVLHSPSGFTISGNGGGASPSRSSKKNKANAGPQIGPAVEAAGNEETRISPREHKDSNGKSYWEKMQSTIVDGKSGREIRIDVDREGGVFLDHGELADLLQSGTIDEVITKTDSAIRSAKHTMDNAHSDHYKWDPKKR